MIPVDANFQTARPFDTVSSTAQSAPGTQSKPVDSPEEKKLRKAAGDFESILLASMWKAMKESFNTSDSQESDPAHGTLEDWGIEVMSGAVGKAGGLGIGKLILKHLEPTLNSQADQKSATSAKVVGGSADKGR